ncbi:hypothetical protein EDD16DRAFT_1582947 [Pisolithus croceorrhizus]|nr:hypothetical protein EDD16DRAFT_1582947 [Pisolithus croceorrhizus]KAI6160570.1 hypothetical protein EDD17DRAFT_794324 [Pisolithus thermaeus]
MVPLLGFPCGLFLHRYVSGVLYSTSLCMSAFIFFVAALIVQFSTNAAMLEIYAAVLTIGLEFVHLFLYRLVTQPLKEGTLLMKVWLVEVRFNPCRPTPPFSTPQIPKKT